MEAITVSANELAYLPESSNSFSFYALPDSQILINGVEIGSEYCSGVDLGLAAADDDAIVLYECDELYGDCRISVIHDGKEVSLTETALGKCYIPGASKSFDGELAEFVEGFIYAYINFSADKDDATETNFAALAKYLLSSSELYDLTSKTIENITWATTSDLVYNNIDYFDLIPLGNDKYICSISYDISYTLGAENLHVESGNLILIEKIDGKYCVSDMGAALQ